MNMDDKTAKFIQKLQNKRKENTTIMIKRNSRNLKNTKITERNLFSNPRERPIFERKIAFGTKDSDSSHNYTIRSPNMTIRPNAAPLSNLKMLSPSGIAKPLHLPQKRVSKNRDLSTGNGAIQNTRVRRILSPTIRHTGVKSLSPK
jgi:hypothetical protein